MVVPATADTSLQSADEVAGAPGVTSMTQPGNCVDAASGEPLFASSARFETSLRLAELHPADRTPASG